MTAMSIEDRMYGEIRGKIEEQAETESETFALHAGQSGARIVTMESVRS